MAIRSWRWVGPEEKFFGGAGVLVPMVLRASVPAKTAVDERAIQELEARVGVPMAADDPMRGAAGILERALIEKLGCPGDAPGADREPIERSPRGEEGGEA